MDLQQARKSNVRLGAKPQTQPVSPSHNTEMYKRYTAAFYMHCGCLDAVGQLAKLSFGGGDPGKTGVIQQLQHKDFVCH